MIKIAVLKNYFGAANPDTFAAVGAFFFDYNHRAIFALIDRFFGADFLAFTTLNTNARFVSAGLRKMRFDTEGRFFGIDFLKMMHTANLHAQAAACAVGRDNFYSFFIHCIPYLNRLNALRLQSGYPDYQNDDNHGQLKR
jgi:hypothetical protein